MKNAVLLFLVASLFACSKKDAIEPKAVTGYQIRIAAVNDNGTKSYTSILRVKSGNVAVEFETDEVTGVKEYDVEVSSDGRVFKSVKVIAADTKTPNKLYQDTVVLP